MRSKIQEEEVRKELTKKVIQCLQWLKMLIMDLHLMMMGQILGSKNQVLMLKPAVFTKSIKF